MITPYKDGPSTCPKCGAPTYYSASGDTESQGAFGTHRYVAPRLTVDEILPTTPLTALRETELRAEAFENYLQRHPGEVGRLTGETP